MTNASSRVLKFGNAGGGNGAQAPVLATLLLPLLPPPQDKRPQAMIATTRSSNFLVLFGANANIPTRSPVARLRLFMPDSSFHSRSSPTLHYPIADETLISPKSLQI